MTAAEKPFSEQAPAAEPRPALHSLDEYLPMVGAAEVEDLRMLAKPLEGATVEMVNSTAAHKLGEQGHEHVRENFLITRNVKRYLTLFLHFSQ
jgi:hypothetical protein